MVAGPRPLDPFVENRTQMGCAVSFVWCLKTREWPPRMFKCLARAKGQANDILSHTKDSPPQVYEVVRFDMVRKRGVGRTSGLWLVRNGAVVGEER